MGLPFATFAAQPPGSGQRRSVIVVAGDAYRLKVAALRPSAIVDGDRAVAALGWVRHRLA